MNKIFRIVFNAATGRYVVASEMAKGRAKSARRTVLLAGIVTALAGGASPAFASIVINGTPQESTVGCEVMSDSGTTAWVYSTSAASCLSPAGTGASGQGNPGKRVMMYSSDTVNGNEDSINVGGYFDTWKTATFHGGLVVSPSQVIDMGGNKVTNVGAGALSSTSTDAVNGSQLDATNQKVTAIDGRVTKVEGDVTNLQTTVNNISNGTAGLVQQSAAGANLTVGKDTDGAAVDFTGTAGARKLQGVADGEISATSKEAINGSQLNATNQAVAQNTSDIAALDSRVTTNEGAITALDTRMGTAESDIATLKDRADTTDVAVAKNTSDIAALDTRMGTAETNIAQNTSDIATLQDRADQTDAAVAQNSADIAKNTSDISALDGRMGTAEGNISNLDSRVTNVEGSVNNLNQQINNGEVGLVKQDAASRTITVAADKDGSEVNFAGTQGARKLSGVAAGEVSATSQEAVNGSQLNATNERVAASEAAIGGLDSRVTKNEGDIVNIDNRTTKNEGDIANLDQRQGKTEGDVSNLRSDVDGLDGRVTTVETSVAGLNEKLAQTSSDVITQSRSYTDSRVDSLHREMDDRFNVQDERIDRMGAMGSAMSMMTASLGGLHTQNRAAVGTGFVNGEKALSVGYQRAMSDRANFTLGGAFTHDDRSIGGAVGLGW